MASSSSRAPAPVLLERVEVRPLAIPLTTDGEAAARAWVSAQKASGASLAMGEVFTTHGWEFGVLACAPRVGGALCPSTEVAVGSQTVQVLKRLQLTLMELPAGSEEAESALYAEFVRPFLLRLRAAMNMRGGNVLRVVAQDEVVIMNGRRFGVRALDPSARYGALCESTDVYVEYIESPALARIHVLPYEESLPCAYQFDLFADFLKPFFQEHPFAVFGEGDHFTYSSVRFRVMATDPAGVVGRVATETMVYSEGEALRPTIWDVLPPDLRAELQRLPRGLQMLLLNTMAHEEAVRGRVSEVDSVLRRGRGVASAQLSACGRESRWRAAENVGETQQQCMVCLADFAEDDLVVRLDCDHLFHAPCIREWLQRSATCPICKRAVVAGGAAGGGGDPLRRGAEGRGTDTGAQLLQLSQVTWNGGRSCGTVTGVDTSSQRLRIAPAGGGTEQLVPADDATQRLRGVRLRGLQGSIELNGQLVEIVGWDAPKGRYLVLAPDQRTLSVRPENCVLPTGTVARISNLSHGGAGRVVADVRRRDAGRF